MKRIIYCALSLISLLTSFCFANVKYEVKKLIFLPISSSINPAIYNYLETNISPRSFEQGEFVIIKLNTPGGLVSTTKDIITLIGSSKVPIGIWITPEGASATSAGAIIASSGHILVMSEGTNIGAATPITMGKDIDQKDARSKAINDLMALVRSLSKARGRAPNEFEKMISEAKSLDAKEALKLNVIDQIINNQKELINFINGRSIKINGREITLTTAENLDVQTKDMDIGQKILNIFANPTTAYVLFIIGAALLYFEMQAPGGFVAGSIGVIFLVLAAIGFQVLPLNLGAMGLIILSFILFVLEAYITSFGLITLAGIASLIFGSLFLFRTDNSLIDLETSAIISVISAISSYVIFLGWYFVRTHQKRKNHFSVQGEFGHISKELGVIDGQHQYQVKVEGEIWNAQASEQLHLGQKVKIIDVNEANLMTKIEKA